MIYQLLSDRFIDQRGFGLLSIVFMILTLSIGAITVMTMINPSTLTRQNRETVEKARILRAAIQSYQFSHGGISGTTPLTLDALVVNAGACTMDNNPTHVTYQYLQGWCGPYVDQVFEQNLADYKTDGWGTLFSYNSVTNVITSCGPDKSCGGADDLIFNP